MAAPLATKLQLGNPPLRRRGDFQKLLSVAPTNWSTFMTINEIAHKAVSSGWTETEIKHVFATVARKQVRSWADNMLSKVVRSHNLSRRKERQ